jgi:putative flavoprotein involved in K+ transport
MSRTEVVVVGAGQAGLAVSHELSGAGVEHVVLERGRVGQTWRGRWDSFCLVTPNWSVRLPGHPYDGDDPDGYMPGDHVVAYLERYAASMGAAVREGVAVELLEPAPGGGFRLETSAGELHSSQAVLCTGAYQRPHRPAAAASLPAELLQIDVEDYHRPDDLPAGAVLVVGSGQSGCQIAEELHEDGRDVFLACGRAAWGQRRLGDRDLFWWALQSGWFDRPFSSLEQPSDRLAANFQATGHRGGHDLHYRTLRNMGVTLLGHFLGTDGRHARFAADLGQSVAWGDQRNAKMMDMVRAFAAERGLAMPEIPEPEPFDPDAPERVPLSELGAVVFAAGFRPNYESWVHVPGAFDELGFPVHREGASVAAPGLYFVGVHFLRKARSALLVGVGEDAALVAGQVAEAATR